MTHLHHTVLFTLHEGVGPDRVVEVLEASRPEHGLVSWRIRRSIDERKGTIIAELAVFESATTFETYRTSAEHRSAGEYMAQVSDWIVADWVE